MADTAVVNVIIPTYNRADLLATAVEHVMNQEAGTPPFDLTIVDNNSSDSTRDVAAQLCARYGPRLRYQFESRQGLSHARNAGIATGTAAIVAFTDDDVRVARNWVSEIVSAFERYPDADFVGGKVLPRWPVPPPKWLTPAHWGALALTDFGDAPFVVDARKPLCLIGASLACRRQLLDAIGMFDPKFQHKRGTVSSVEDYDLELRAWRVGRRGIYVPNVVVTADVQPERLGKRYHRRWHRDHGRLFPALLRPGEGFASDGALITLPARGRRLFGVPLWMLRRTGSLAWAFVRAAFAGRPDRAFELEGALIEHLATISTVRGGIN